MPQRRILVNVNRKKRHPLLPQPLASSATTAWEGFLLVSQSWSSFMGAIKGRKRTGPRHYSSAHMRVVAGGGNFVGANGRTNFKLIFQVAMFPLVVLAFGCGGGGGGYGGTTQQGQQQPPPPATLDGSWEIHFQSLVNPANATVVEANLMQSGTRVFSGAPATLLYRGQGPDAVEIPLSQFGGSCDNDGNDQVTFDGTVTGTPSTSRSISFTVAETGGLGSSVITAMASTDGSHFANGTYSIPAACGSAEDHGTFEGFRDSFQLNSGDAFAGNFNGGSDAIVLRFTNDATGFGITATGTDNGSPFTITGSTVGLSVTLTGTVLGNTVTWFGVYNSTYNWFSFYGPDGRKLGTLSGK